MTGPEELAGKVLAAVRGVEGLRPSVPAVPALGRLAPWDPEAAAVDVGPDLLVVRVVADRLPLPPLLARAEAAVLAAVSGSGWAGVTVRLVVTDVDGAAVRALDGAADRDHPIGP